MSISSNNKKKLNINIFIKYYENFIKIPTWTKIKYSNYGEFKNILRPYLQDSISTTRVHSKYNHCGHSKTFTVKQVPFDIKGKLSKYSGEWVLMYCDTYQNGSWTNYCNEIYLLQEKPSSRKISLLRKKFHGKFIEKD